MVTVFGRFVDATGNPRSGSVRFTPTRPISSGDAVVADGVKARLDAQGEFSVDLIASDEPGNDVPVPYWLRMSIAGRMSLVAVMVPGPGPVDVLDLEPVDQIPCPPEPVPC